jgi:glucan phosphoethanolaminetransferase (alkaline phosphatase superfamily)
MKNLLLNPFEKYSEQKLLPTGILALLIGASVTYMLKCKFIGVLKVTFIDDASIEQSIFDSIIIAGCLTLLLFLAAKYIYTKTRLIDIIVTVLIGYIPFYLLTLFNIKDTIQITTENLMKHATPELANQLPMDDLIIIIIFGFISIFIIIWFIILLYNGFKTATNAKGNKPKIIFGIAILLADIISRILIASLN